MLGNACRNLHEIGIRMTPGDALVPAPCLTGGGIKPIGFECIASSARARDALRTTFARRRRDIHHAAKFAVSFADGYKVITFHMFSSGWARRPGGQTAPPWSRW